MGRRIAVTLNSERQEDGWWIADVPALPGVLAYGDDEAQSRARPVSLGSRVIADRIEKGEPLPEEASKPFVV
jgi:predicted RNase H-like HicB family nuclease